MSGLRYADDTALIAADAEDLQKVFDRLDHWGNKYGLRINTENTKFLVFSKAKLTPEANITVRGSLICQVDSFPYLGSLMTSDARSDKDIGRRIALAKQAFSNMKDIMKSDIGLALRKRLLQCYIWPVLFYGCEAWSVSKATFKKREAFEMWCYRRMLRISYKDHITNGTVLLHVGTSRQMVNIYRCRKLWYFGHVVREGGIFFFYV